MNGSARSRPVGVACLLALCSRWVFAYEVELHQRITEAAVAKVLQTNDFLSTLGISPTRTFAQFPPSPTLRAVDWITFGSASEDAYFNPRTILPRSTFHFFDPTTERGYLQTYEAAPDWAQDSYYNPVYSIPEARNSLYSALTNTDATVRERQWADFFRAVGQFTHLVQDMAQPQHVRDDNHFSVSEELNRAFPKLLWSRYETFTRDFDLSNLPGYPVVHFPDYRSYWKSGDGRGMAEFANKNFVSEHTNLDSGLYPSPSLAQTFTTQVVVPQVIDVFNNPVPGATKVTVRYLGNSYVDLVTSEQTTNNYLSTRSMFDFIRNQYVGKDVYTLNNVNYTAHANILVRRAIGYSAGIIDHLFRGSLEINVPQEGVYAIADHSRPEVNLKVSGGFGMIKARVRNVTVDLVPSGGTTPIPQGMTTAGTLVAVVKFHRNDCYAPDLSGEYSVNLPPDGVAYPPSGCDMAPCPAVVEVAPNVTYPPANCGQGAARSQTPAEEIVVSNSVPVTSAINSTNSSGGQVAVFTFAQPIPINARDTYLQIVYRGPLGQENDAIAVGTKDISEPSYYTIANMTDYVMCVNGTYYRNNPDGSISDAEKSAILAAGGNDLAFSNPQYLRQTNDKIVVAIQPPYNYDGSNPPFTSLIPVTVDPNLQVVAAKDNLAPGQYLRLTFLTDRAPNSAGLTPNPFEVAAADQGTGANFHWYFWNAYPAWSSVNQRNESENVASGNFKFRDLRTTNNLYMTYKTYFSNTNCFATALATIDQSSPSPSQLVPFTSFTFGTP